LINKTQVTSYGILLEIDQIKVLGVYLPPSLSHSDILNILDPFKNPSILFGDLNVRFKGISKGQPSSSSLQEFWLNWLRTHSFHMAVPYMEEIIISQACKDTFQKSHSSLLSSRFSPTVGDSLHLIPNCELDHLFHSTSISVDLQLIGSAQFNFKTVHKYIMCAIINISQELEFELREGMGRFCLEKLERPGITNFLSKAWSNLDSDLNWNMLDVDTYDFILANSVQAVAEEVMCTYDVFERRKAPDDILSFLNSQISAIAAVRLFKRKQRNMNPRSIITSDVPTETPTQQCISKFESTFFTTTSESVITTLPSQHSQYDKVILSQLEDCITVSKIRHFIKNYPKDKACGNDSIHTILLNALETTSFFSRLSGLFSLCIQSCHTPSRWNE